MIRYEQEPGQFALKFSTVLRVWVLEIQRRIRKGHHCVVGRVQLPSNGPNIKKNITVATMAFHEGIKALKNRTKGWVKTGMVNARSIKGKIYYY